MVPKLDRNQTGRVVVDRFVYDLPHFSLVRGVSLPLYDPTGI